MKKILITGIAGFIGSNLAVRLLNEGKYEIVGIDNLSAGVLSQVPDGVKFFPLDIRSKEIAPLFEGVDFVFHLAAKNCISDCQKDPVETADVNITGTINVFECARRAGVKKVIYAESSALYEGADLMPTPEDALAPQSFYSLSKLSGMHFAEGYRRFYHMNFTALRYFCVYGPRQDYRRTIPPVMSAFIIHLLQGKRPAIYGSGNKRRDFVYVDDVNDFHLSCLTNPMTDGKAFNLGSGNNYSINEIFAHIASLLQSDVKPLYMPDLPGEAIATLADIRQATSVGWRPKTSLEQGLIKSIEYIQKVSIK